MLLVTIIAVLLSAGGVAFAIWVRPKLRAMTAQDEAFTTQYNHQYQEIIALPHEEARRRAELLLADPRRLLCVPALSPLDTGVAPLASGLQSLFSRFESIQVVDSESLLSRELIAPFGWDWKEGPWRRYQFWQIGTAHEHAVILVRPQLEGVYDTDGMDEGEDLEEPDFPSVYHWLLMATSLVTCFTPGV